MAFAQVQICLTTTRTGQSLIKTPAIYRYFFISCPRLRISRGLARRWATKAGLGKAVGWHSPRQRSPHANFFVRTDFRQYVSTHFALVAVTLAGANTTGFQCPKFTRFSDRPNFNLPRRGKPANRVRRLLPASVNADRQAPVTIRPVFTFQHVK